MNKINDDLVSLAERYVVNLLETQLPQTYLFHSIKHTRNVLRNAILIGQNSGLTPHEMSILQVSALFHDVGYIISGDDHEAEGAFIAAKFLHSDHIDDTDIEMVANAITSTKVPQHPIDLISSILCDADLMHLGAEDYFDQMDLLRREWQLNGKKSFSEQEFHLNSIDFFNQHHYHTDYGKTVLQGKKDKTLQELMKIVGVV